MSRPDGFVVVRTFSHPHEAHLACSALTAAGLAAHVADDKIVAANWLYSNAIGGVKLMVPAGEVAAVREILEFPAVLEPDGTLDPVADQGADACPRCGSQNIGTLVRGRRLAALTWLLARVPLFPVWRRTHCRSCGFVFK